MLILATNLSSTPLINLALTYVNLSGQPITDMVTVPAKPTGSFTGSVVSGSQQASSFTSVSITIGATTYNLSFGQGLPPGLGVKAFWAQNSDASILVVTDDALGSI